MNQEESSIRSLKSVRRNILEQGPQGGNEILSSPMGRMAPTPSGFLHLGNIVNFLLTGIIAQKKASPVFLRIDDLDKDRCRDIYLEDIFHTLDFLNLPYFGPTSLGEFKKEYSQHNRIERYREVFEMIVDRERYFCTCSRREILERLGAKTSLQYDGY